MASFGIHQSYGLCCPGAVKASSTSVVSDTHPEQLFVSLRTTTIEKCSVSHYCVPRMIPDCWSRSRKEKKIFAFKEF